MVAMLIQLSFLLIFGLYVRYDEALMPKELPALQHDADVMVENRTGSS